MKPRFFALILALLSFTQLAGAQSPSAQTPTFENVHRLNRSMLSIAPGLRESPYTALVRFRPGTSEAAKSRAAASAGVHRVRKYTLVDGFELVYAPHGTLISAASLSANPNVLYAGPDRVVRLQGIPSDPSFSLQWGMHQPSNIDVNGPEAWDTYTGDSGFAIAVIDSGIETSHPDLAGNIWTNPDEIAGNGIDDDANGYVDDVHGWDFFDHDNDPTDTHGHGTHVAGIIGARHNNGIGVAGMMPQCKMIALRFAGDGSGFTSDAILSLEYAINEGARVSNNSWGSIEFDYSLYEAIGASQLAGHLFIAAAGNEGQDADLYPFYPASFPHDNIISVMSMQSDGFKAPTSNWGQSSVDIAAPGQDVFSTYLGGGYFSLSGTSMAAPHVAGTAAMVWAQNPSWSYGQVALRIFTRARVSSYMGAYNAWSATLDTSRAIVDPKPEIYISTPSDGATHGQGVNVAFGGFGVDSSGMNFTSSLVWTSSLDGQIGTGGNFARNNLSMGVHTITLTGTAPNNGLTNSKSITVTIVAGPPAAPSGLSAVKLSAGVAKLTWTDNSSSETGFQIERQKKSGGSWINTTIWNVGANVTTVNDSAGAGTFRYRVRAFNAGGSSAWTGYVNVGL